MKLNRGVARVCCQGQHEAKLQFREREGVEGVERGGGILLSSYAPFYQPTNALRERRKLPSGIRAEAENNFRTFYKRHRTPVLHREPDMS